MSTITNWTSLVNEVGTQIINKTAINTFLHFFLCYKHFLDFDNPIEGGPCM